MPRLIALLSFYDEDSNWLRAYVEGLKRANVHTLVALDGAYALYPDGTPASPAHQHAALREACTHADIRLALHIPHTTWAGGEIEKRTTLMALGDQAAEPGDWLLILDADEHILHAPGDLARRLNTQDRDVAGFTLRCQHALHGPGPDDTIQEGRRLMRASLGITIQNNHCTYITRDGRVLWSATNPDAQEPALCVDDIHIVHLTRHRAEQRRARAGQYYQLRDHLNAETR